MGAAAKVVAVGAAAVVMASGVAGHHHHGGPAAARAVAFAKEQVGKPYCWGGTGSSCYDCSGLVMEAYRDSIPRTSQAQWAALPHVSHPRPGDLVYAPGSDGSWSAPGHVGLVISGGRVIQAYGTGTDIMVSSLSNFAAGAGGIVGYARPGGA